MITVLQDITFISDNLTLEGVLHLPSPSGNFPGVVICHPHPRYGGDMHDSVVTALAHSICDAGIAALRFNFRGVGNSEGVFDNGDGEERDVREALSFLALHDSINPSRIGIAGYSFGAWMALQSCDQNNLVQAVASIACPMRPFSDLGVNEMLQPKLLVCGDLDHDFPAEQFKFLSKRFSEPREVELMYGVDHFFRGREPEVGTLAAAFFSRRLGDEPS